MLTRPAGRANGSYLGQKHRVARGGVTGTGLMVKGRLIHATWFARAAIEENAAYRAEPPASPAGSAFGTVTTP